MYGFQILCLLFLPLAYYLLYRIDRDVLFYSPIIFLAGWLGEASSIYFYDFYHYSDEWWVRVAGVPLMVPLIWPLVILSSRAVIRSLWPNLGKAMPLAVGVMVLFDAAMIEVAAVNCGLWGWAEYGYLGVPLAGIVGWAIFAVIVAAFLERLSGVQKLWTVIAAPVMLHLILVPAWWLFLKWYLRGDWFWAFSVFTAILTLIVLLTRGRRRMGMDVAAPRLIAAGLFVVLVVVMNFTAWPVWRHILMTSVPYVLATDFQRKMLAGKPS